MIEKSRYKIPLNQIQLKSLAWVGDDLVDYAGGITTFHLDGNKTLPKYTFGSLFDNAIVTSDGIYAVIYQTLGTKALLLKNGKLLRELNRSYYCAEVFEYPITFLTVGEKVCIAHCPDKYNIIEVEEIETGIRLTGKEKSEFDFFQSRLQISPNQKKLLSAGWIWHPIDSIEIYNFSESITNPQILDTRWENSIEGLDIWEINNAVFIDDEKILLSGIGNLKDEDENEEISLVVYDLEKKVILSQTKINEPTGLLMPLNEIFAVGFYKHPKIFDLQSGKIIKTWTDIPTDERNSSILWHLDNFAKIAIDVENKRFAVGTENTIEVIDLE